jgi:hypothetical protein
MRVEWCSRPRHQPDSFEKVLTSMDAILVGGGNTLNMIAVWKAQGIDTALRKAWDNGVVLGGGGEYKPGYATDDRAGIYFENERSSRWSHWMKAATRTTSKQRAGKSPSACFPE